MRFDEYRLLDATALAGLIAAREISASEILTTARTHGQQVNPAINAIVGWMDRAAEERVRTATLSGSMAGVPFLIKDIAMEYAGEPSSYGSRALKNEVASRHALVTQRFLDAGVVIFGRTNVPELGAKGVTESTLWGPARNPWDLSRTPGGSSGGAAAAVSAGIVPAAAANDGAGSIRIPAACTGLVGLKMSRGLSPHGPHTGELMGGVLSQGVVSRTVRDTAAFCDALIGHHPAAGFRAATLPEPLCEAIRREPPQLRVGWTYASSINPSPHHDAQAAVSRTAALLSDLGHAVDQVDLPYDDAALARDFLTIWFAHLHSHVCDIRRRTGARRGDFEPDTLAIAELGRAAGLEAVHRAQGRINDHLAAIATYEAQYDILLTPTLAEPPPKIGRGRPSALMARAASAMSLLRAGGVAARSGVVNQIVNENLSWVPYTQIANLTGRPALSLPLHQTSSNLPIGVQLMAGLHADGLLLQLAAQLERAAPWAHLLPEPGLV